MLAKPTITANVFLASQSPRRRAAIEEISNHFSILNPRSDEPDWNGLESPEAYLTRCVDHKMSTSLEYLWGQKPSGPWIVVVADTSVILQRKVLGKPSSRAQAMAMLSLLSGKRHEVWTRIGVASGLENKLLFKKFHTEVTSVWFRNLAKSELRSYVSTGSSYDKAGAYGFQDHALRFVSRMEGSYSNVVGLPVLKLEALMVEADGALKRETGN